MAESGARPQPGPQLPVLLAGSALCAREQDSLQSLPQPGRPPKLASVAVPLGGATGLARPGASIDGRRPTGRGIALAIGTIQPGRRCVRVLLSAKRFALRTWSRTPARLPERASFANIATRGARGRLCRTVSAAW